MNVSRIIPGLAILILVACASSPELKHNMISKKTQKPAVEEQLGCTLGKDTATFRIFAPSAAQVELILFQTYDATDGDLIPMHKQSNGVWVTEVKRTALRPYYAYRNPDQSNTLIADPYSRAVVRQNNFRYPSKTVIVEDDQFDWEGDQFTGTQMGDLVMLEAHLRDMTIHPSAMVEQAGTYEGFVEASQRGGIVHLQDMGYNAIEFLPLQEFGNIEIDYKNPDLHTWNDWNPYENNHWGYMTSFFFVPEIYYGSEGTSQRDVWVGQDGRVIQEMKRMVKALHKAGISVIVDVVYNHVSQYDENPFKLIDREVYFRLDENGNYLGTSGCGNDFRTEHPMARKMIIESLVYWMETFHVDGFRFDLAAMIDLETVDAITEATRAINPDVILIGEPWGGGGYNPAELADHGWASWNDHFRNSVKGRNPRQDDYGFIFGKLWDGHDLEHYQKLMRGYLQDEGGHYRQPAQSVNYLESHDDHTMGDFIRIALGKVGAEEAVKRDQVATLSPEEIKIHKFAALQLFTSQGPVMVAQGQSWGRAKVIANSIGTDPKAGQLDHNSYEKDDETNWLNWDEKELNKELVDYYRGLIRIRHEYAPLRDVRVNSRAFFQGEQPQSYGFSVGSPEEILVLINGESQQSSGFNLPAGEWHILVNHEYASLTRGAAVSNRVTLHPQSGMILVK